MTAKRFVIGTRGSELALWQSNHIKSRLEAFFPNTTFELLIIKTLGDKILDSPLSKIGDKGLFTKEIERALLDQTIDLAVHSLKDIPTVLPEGLAIGAVARREDVRDVFIAHPKKSPKRLRDLPQHARVATGSLRRKCQLLHVRPDFEIIDVRGNLKTRMKKLEDSDWDGMILAAAGVKRLGWAHRISEIIPFEILLPAVGQGALALEIRKSDKPVLELTKQLHDNETAQSVNGERALLKRLEGGCQVPIGTFGRIEQGLFKLDALIGSIDGKRVIKGSIQGAPDRSEELGAELAGQLLAGGGKRILDEIRAGQQGTQNVGV